MVSALGREREEVYIFQPLSVVPRRNPLSLLEGGLEDIAT
jgi:hypothetical protein